MASSKTNRVSQLAADQKLIDGTKQFLSAMPTLTVGGQDMTPAQIEQVLQDRINSGNAAVKADDARKAAVAADRAERQKTAPTVNAFRRIVIGMFMSAPDKLGVFGLQAPKVPKKSAATKAAAAATAQATKTARGPIGKVQRAAIKAPHVTLEPVTAPAATGTAPATAAVPATAPTQATATSPATPPSPPATPVASPVAAASKAGS
jgi:hypothetical protein